jgi:hypothetical protein
MYDTVIQELENRGGKKEVFTLAVQVGEAQGMSRDKWVRPLHWFAW